MITYIQPFNPGRNQGETFEAYKLRRAQQNSVCKQASKIAGIAWDSMLRGTRIGKLPK